MKVLSYSSIKKGQLIRENIIQRANRWTKYVSDKIEKQQKKNKTSKRIAIPHQQQFFSILYSHIRKLSAILAASDCIFFNQLEPGVVRDLIRTNNSSGGLETCRT